MSVEEAKLEMATLLLQQQASKSLVSARRGGVLEQRSVRDLMFGGADEEIMVLRAELRAAVQGEERRHKALDDISTALSDVTAEARQVVFGKNGGLEQTSSRKGYVDMCTVDATTLTKISE
ncbi:hypothetical protein ACJX0J_042367, partial [Zea mays]